jgi:hypothetical protein
MAKCFEFQRISTEITKEHRGLFAWLADKPKARGDHERNMGGFESLCQTVEFIPIENSAEVWNGDFDSVDMTMGHFARHYGGYVRGDLVSEEIEIDPRFRASAFGTTEQFAIEATRRSQIDDGKGVMERFRHGARR